MRSSSQEGVRRLYCLAPPREVHLLHQQLPLSLTLLAANLDDMPEGQPNVLIGVLAQEYPK